jgi:sugar phosphate isomerase/epimerase
MSHKTYRREFIREMAASGLTLASHGLCAGVGNQHRVKWPIGCFNRPWTPWTYDQAIAGIKAAGFRLTGFLGDHADEPFTSTSATQQYLDALRERIEKSGLELHVAWLRTRHDVPLAESTTDARKQVDHASSLGVKYLLTMGVDQPEMYAHFYRVMADVAAYAADRGIQIAMKPHGGCSAAAEEMLRTMEKVAHANFRIWYDAGNIVHYTDADPVVDVARVAEFVVGFSAKDCAARGGDVMLQFGEGKVDFKGVFAQLRKAGFEGPVMVECCRGKSLSDLTENARANRLFLEQVFASL